MTPAPREREFLDAAAARGLRPAGDGFAEKTLREVSSFFSRALFREKTARRSRIFRRVDPRARLLGILVFLVSVSFARSIDALLLHAGLVALAVALARIRPSEFLFAGFLPALAFSVVMAAPAALNLFREGSVVLPLWRIGEGIRLGPVALPPVIGVTREGALSAVTFLLRVLSSVSAALWLTLSTRWVDILRALRSLRLPPVFLQVIGMTVRYVHVLLRQSEEVHLGKKSRTVCRREIAAEQAWAGSRLAHAWERSVHLMDEVHSAMAARGFTGEAKIPPGTRFRGADWAFLGVVMVSCAGAHFA